MISAWKIMDLPLYIYNTWLHCSKITGTWWHDMPAIWFGLWWGCISSHKRFREQKNREKWKMERPHKNTKEDHNPQYWEISARYCLKVPFIFLLQREYYSSFQSICQRHSSSAFQFCEILYSDYTIIYFCHKNRFIIQNTIHLYLTSLDKYFKI